MCVGEAWTCTCNQIDPEEYGLITFGHHPPAPRRQKRIDWPINLLIPGDTLAFGDPYGEHTEWTVVERNDTTLVCEEHDVVPYPDPGPPPRREITISDKPIRTLEPRVTQVYPKH